MGKHIDYRHITDITDGEDPAMPALCGYVRPGGWDFGAVSTYEDVQCPECVTLAKQIRYSPGTGKHIKDRWTWEGATTTTVWTKAPLGQGWSS